MKKVIISFFICVFCLFSAAAQLMNELNSGKPFGIDNASDCSVMKNGKGELFLIYCRDDALYIFKSIDNGACFTEYDAGLAANGFTRIRNIVMFNRTVSQSLLFFTAQKDNSDGIYCLGFDDNNNLVPESAEPFSSEDVTGDIITYQPRYIGGGAYCVLYIKGNSLGYTYIDDSDTVYKKQIIDTCVTIADFTLKGRIVNGEFRECGTYSIEENGIYRLFYFETAGETILFTNFIAAFDPVIAPRQVIGKTGSIYTLFMKDNYLYGKKLENTDWQDINNGDPLSAGINGKIESFESYLFDDQLFIFCNTLSDGEHHAYLSMCSGTIPCAVLNDGNPLSPGSISGNPAVLFLVDRSILISFLYGSSRNLWCRKYKIDGDYWESMETIIGQTNAFEQAAGCIVNTWYPVLSFVESVNLEHYFSLIHYSYETGAVKKIASLPLPSGALSFNPITKLNTTIIAVQNGSIITLIDSVYGTYESVPGESYYAINDSIQDKDFICIKKSDGYYLYSYDVK